MAMLEVDDEPAQMAYAQSLADWADAGGYEHETLWDVCTVAAIGMPFEQAQWRSVRTLSGGEQKRLVLEALLRGPDEVLGFAGSRRQGRPSWSRMSRTCGCGSRAVGQPSVRSSRSGSS